MPSPTRITSFLKRRLSGLPRGISAIRYLFNTIAFQKALRTKSLRLPYPNALMLELTNCCNLACVTCPRVYDYGKAMDVGSMDPAHAMTLLSEVGPYLDKIGISGLGESFLYPHAAPVLSHLRSLNPGVEIVIASNLSLPDLKETFATWATHINTVQISIDGIGEVFDAIRKKGDYSQFLNNLRAVVDISRMHSIYLKFNMVVFGKNYHQMAEIVSLADTFNIPEIYLNRLNPVSIDASLFDEKLYASNEFHAALNAAQQRARQTGRALYFPQSMNNKYEAGCSYPWNNSYITWDGYLVPCCAKPFPKEMHFGNVFEDGFIKCFNSQKAQDFRREMKSGKLPGFCQGCC